MIFQLSLTNPPQVLKEGDHPSFQLKQAKKIDKERGQVDASIKGKAMKSSLLLGTFCGLEFWGFSLLKI